MVRDYFNVKIYHYADKDQVRLYRCGIECQDNKRIDRDGVIHELSRPLFQELNPFTGQYEHMKDFKEDSRSDVVSMNRTINTVYELSRANSWEYFFTMTFNKAKVDRYNYDACVKKLSQWLNNTRKKYAPDMVYLVVPELHEDGAFHFHGLFSNIGRLPLKDSGIRDKGRIIYNLPTYELGWTTVSMVGDSGRASSYVCKYITKDLCAVTSGRKRYWVSRNAKRPEVETFILEGDLFDKVANFNGHIEYNKTVDTLYQSVTYLELDCRVSDLELFEREENVDE